MEIRGWYEPHSRNRAKLPDSQRKLGYAGSPYLRFEIGPDCGVTDVDARGHETNEDGRFTTTGYTLHHGWVNIYLRVKQRELSIFRGLPDRGPVLIPRDNEA